MKKTISLIIAVAVMLGLLALPAFADGGTLSEEQLEALEAVASFVVGDSFDVGCVDWKSPVIYELQSSSPEYVKDEDGILVANAPVDVIKNAFNKTISSAPKGYWDSHVLPKLEEDGNLNKESNMCRIEEFMGGGMPSYGYVKYEDNKDGTYGLYYALIEDYGEDSMPIFGDTGKIITLKPEADGTALVSIRDYGDNATTPDDSGSENEVPSSGSNNSSSKPASENPNTADNSSAAVFAIIGVTIAALCISAKKAKAFR